MNKKKQRYSLRDRLFKYTILDYFVWCFRSKKSEKEWILYAIKRMMNSSSQFEKNKKISIVLYRTKDYFYE